MDDKYTLLDPQGRGNFTDRHGKLYLTLSHYLDTKQMFGRQINTMITFE